jgi:Zn finger protein HypA/HybF involved in hydrogenase expression
MSAEAPQNGFSAVTEANKYVLDMEGKWLCNMSEELERLKERAEICGCPQCRKDCAALREEIGLEIDRIMTAEQWEIFRDADKYNSIWEDAI